ncbi:hypothetical protein Mapa_000422 [Marchantia paleacea]|nr:hypothetical protein Mapa_000422 [Marchantia paleacea]
MALGGAAVAAHGLSGSLVGCENFWLEQVSCSYGCASQSRILARHRFGSSAGLSSGLRMREVVSRSTQRRDRFAVFAADERNDSESSGSSEADVEALESRLGLGRRQRREGGSGEPKPRPAPPSQPKAEKKWEDMSLLEQAWSLYIGEKGFLFWLNKLAYASIFGLIGGWIVFRFVGPALGWYELDSPLLPPDQLLG